MEAAETHQQTAKRVKRRLGFGLFSIVELLGWPLFLMGLCILVGSLFMKAGAGGWFGGFAFTLFGYAMIFNARKASTYWLCSNCGNRLTDKEARMCAVCRAPLEE